jgi:formiminotetrahydrofolate cyclodeaminase
MSTGIACKDFLEALASGEPVPGGGAVAALGGALSAALGEMAANLTLGRNGKAKGASGLLEAAAEARRLRLVLEGLAEEDADAFSRLCQARKLPQGTAEEAARRAGLIEEALSGAGAVPLRAIKAAAAVVCLLERIEGDAAPSMASDIGVGALFCRAALLGAAMNVRVNAKFLKDREKAEDFSKKAESAAAFSEKAEALYRRSLARAL